MSLYKNISGKPQYICSNMTKILIQPNSIVDLTLRDLQHCGAALRFFESIVKAKEVADKQMMLIKQETIKSI